MTLDSKHNNSENQDDLFQRYMQLMFALFGMKNNKNIQVNQLSVEDIKNLTVSDDIADQALTSSNYLEGLTKEEIKHYFRNCNLHDLKQALKLLEIKERFEACQVVLEIIKNEESCN